MHLHDVCKFMLQWEDVVTAQYKQAERLRKAHPKFINVPGVPFIYMFICL